MKNVLCDFRGSIFKSFMIIIIIFSSYACESSSGELSYKNFDSPLTKQNMALGLAGDYDKIIALNIKYYKIAERKNYKDGQALCDISLAYVNIYTENYPQALSLLNRAEAILKKTKNKRLEARLYTCYSELNYVFGIYKTSLGYIDKALQCVDGITYPEEKKRLTHLLYFYRGRTLYHMHEYDQAMASFQDAIKIEPGNPLVSSWISNIYIKKNQLDSASIYTQKALEYVRKEKLDNSGKGGRVYLFAGDYYMETKQYDKAEDAYLMALKLTVRKEAYSSFFISDAYNALANFYNKVGDTEKENFYKHQYVHEEEKIYKSQRAEIGSVTQKFISEIENTERDKTRKLWIFIIMAGILVSVTGVYTFKKVRGLHARKSRLQHKTQKLKEQIDVNIFAEVIELAKTNDPRFLARFQELYPEFIEKLKGINSDLESSEISFCAMIKLNFTSKEIANYNYIQHASVQQRKRRIRKRLNIPSDIDLYQFFNNL